MSTNGSAQQYRDNFIPDPNNPGQYICWLGKGYHISDIVNQAVVATVVVLDWLILVLEVAWIAIDIRASLGRANSIRSSTPCLRSYLSYVRLPTILFILMSHHRSLYRIVSIGVVMSHQKSPCIVFLTSVHWSRSSWRHHQWYFVKITPKS